MKTKTKSGRSKEFQSKLAAYSATAAAAVLTTPAAHATIQNITEFSIGHGPWSTNAPSVSSPRGGAGYRTNNASVTFSAGPIQGAKLFAFHFYHKYSWGGGAGFKGNKLYVGPRGAPYSNAEIGRSDGNVGGARWGLAKLLPFQGGTVTGYMSFKDVVGSGSHQQTYYGWFRAKITADNQAPDYITFVPKAGTAIYGAYGLKSDGITNGETATVLPTISIARSGGNLIITYTGTLLSSTNIAGPYTAVPHAPYATSPTEYTVTPAGAQLFYRAAFQLPPAAALGGLGLLAIGAPGVREMRRRRRQEKDS